MMDKKLNPDQLAERLDSLLAANQSTVPAGDSDPLVDAALRLANAPRPPMPPGMMERVQSRMLEAHRQTVQPQPQPQPVAQPVRILHLTRWAVAASFVLVFFLAGLTPAMAGSTPGDLLYPVKQAFEQVELALASAPADQANVHLTQAERRMDEAETLLARGTFTPTLITEALAHLLDSAALTPSPSSELTVRATQVLGRLEGVLQQTEQQQLTAPDTLASLSNDLQMVREQIPVLPTVVSSDGGADTAPVETVPSATPVDVAVLVVPTTVTTSPTVMPSATNTLTATPSPTPSATATDMPTVTPSDTATATLTLIPSPLPTLSTTLTTLLSSTSEVMATVNAPETVNVRIGPGIAYNIIATLQPGESVRVIGVDNSYTWLNVVLTDGTVGWVAAYLLTIDSLPAADALIGTGNSINGGSGDSASISDSNQQGGDFGCDHPGDYCNASGQENKAENAPDKDDKKDKKDKKDK